MKKLVKAFLAASVLALAATSAQAWWDNGSYYGDPVYYPAYYNSDWSDGNFWGDGRGYGRGHGRGHGSGEGSFNFSMSARGSAETDWNGDLSSYGDYYGYAYNAPYYYGPQPVVPMATLPAPETEEPEKQ